MAHAILRAGLLAALLALGAGTSWAAALRVSPVGLDLSAGQGAATLTLGNDADADMIIQVRVFRWRQVNGQDQLEPTDDVVVSPPIGPLAAHAERMIRVVRVSPAVQGEASYRLIIDELPPPPGTEGRQVRLLTRHSIPLFFGSGGQNAAALSWRAQADSQGVTLAGLNAGGRRVRVSNLKFIDAAGASVAVHPGLLGYVLAGAGAKWTLPEERGSRRAVRLIADTDAGPIDVAVSGSP